MDQFRKTNQMLNLAAIHDQLLKMNSWYTQMQETNWWQRHYLSALIDLKTTHLSHWLSCWQARSSNFQVFSLQSCIMLLKFYHCDQICMMQCNDMVQTEGFEKYVLQSFLKNYSSGHKWNRFTQCSRVLTTSYDLCPLVNQKKNSWLDLSLSFV